MLETRVYIGVPKVARMEMSICRGCPMKVRGNREQENKDLTVPTKISKKEISLRRHGMPKTWLNRCDMCSVV